MAEIHDNITKCDRDKVKTNIAVAGYITNVQLLTSKTGSPWSKTIIEDFSGNYEFALFGKDHETFMPYLQMFTPVYIEGVVEEKYYVRPEDRKIKGNPPYAFKIKKISLLGNVANSLLKSFVIKIRTPMLNSTFRERLINLVKSNRGTIPLSMILYDPVTEYNIEFMSRKYKVAVSNPFVNDLKDMDVLYESVRK